ncbi:MAG: DUF1552 domain-containing protein [Planctomycetota bacterium]|nr:DUF1552 domain-containing protein [Planctomycetota bacterium]
MLNKHDHLSRRTLLRGLGVSMALPWLESLSFAAKSSTKTDAQPPTRTLVTFTGMGFHSQHWWAKGGGADMELGPCLTPLEPWKERMVFLRGLWNEQANNGVIHCMQTGNMLSGAPMSKTEVRTGVSFDQLMAQRIGDRTKIPSLVLGCEDALPGLQDGHPLLYSSHISWSSQVSPTWTETRPALAFDQLFRTDRNRGDRRVVDAVLEDARSLRQRLSLSDRQRFEEYLGSVHEIEGRIKRADKERDADAWQPTLAARDLPRPADGIPTDIPEYWKLMNDIVLLAFRTDTTRIATLKYCNDGSAETHTHCGAKDQHHQMAHTQPAELIPLNQYFMSQLAYLCERMSEVEEGNGTLLDNTSIMHCSSMLHGNHDSKQLPILLLGGGGGKLQGGRVLDYLDSPNRRMCSLFLHLMDWGGLELDRFGDSTERLTGI